MKKYKYKKPGNTRRPAAGYAPGEMMFETHQFSNQVDKRRKANKVARQARKKNR